MSAYRRDPSEAFTADERDLYEFTRDADELHACLCEALDDDYEPTETDFLDPTGGWDGWEDQPEWM